MISQNEEAALFVRQEEDRLPILTPLTDTGEATTTITSVVRQGTSPDGELYFLKDDGLESSQLTILRAAGVHMPTVLRSVDGERFATSFAGRPLQERFGHEDDDATILRDAGLLLRHIHDVLDVAPLPEGVLARTYAHTAHSVDCFYYKSIGCEAGISVVDYEAHKRIVAADELPAERQGATPEIPPFIPTSEAFHPQLAELVTAANSVAYTYLGKLLPSVIEYQPQGTLRSAPYLALPDRNICYGDFKPENILADQSGRLTVIDPHLTRGSQYFDLAKFASRYIIEATTPNGREDLYAFYQGYGSMPTQEIPLYGPYGFAELIGIDMLNVLKSYVKRYADGRKSYRLVEALSSPDFCEHLGETISRLPEIRTTGQLDTFLYKTN